MKLSHYLSVYREFFKTSLTEATSFRVNFVLIFFIDLIFFGSMLATVDFIYDHVEKIGVWNRDEFLFFMAFMLFLDHIHMAFISSNFWELSFSIKRGNLDFALLKPIATLFTVFFRNIRVASFLTTPFAFFIIIYFGIKVGLSWQAWALLPLFQLLSLALLTSLEILLSMAMFWTVEAIGINFLRMQFQRVSRWPDFVYQYFARKLFTIVIPILLVGSVPVGVLLEKASFSAFGPFFAALFICWVLIHFFWKRGLRKYESASS